MGLTDRAREAINAHPLSRKIFVAFCAQFAVKLLAIKRYLSLEDLRQRARLRLWRRFRAFAETFQVDRIEIVGPTVILHYSDGCSFQISSHKTSNSQTLLASAEYEKCETALLKRFIAPGWTVIDAGASFGWFTIHLSKWVAAHGKVYAFEPLEQSVGELNRNIALNNCTNVETSMRALGSHAGLIDFYLPGIEFGAGAASRHLDSGTKLTVELTTLDDFVSRHNIDRVDFIKADVEGGELDLLRGAQSVLRAFRPRLLIEIVDVHCKRFGLSPEDVYSFLMDHGYSVRFIAPDGQLLPCDITRLRNGNYLCEPASPFHAAET